MTLADTLGTAPGRWKVFASDIDTEVLEKARSGIYRHEELKNLTIEVMLVGRGGD